ncbi:MAG: hypothetical protein ACLSE5_09040 [Enterococcus avium]
MVDWKELGKKTFDVTKNMTEKSIDSFQEWKDDPERIAKVESKKATKKAQKKIEKAEKVLKNEFKRGKSEPDQDNSFTEKTFEPFSSKGVVEESTYKEIKRVKLSKITQEEPNRISIKQGRRKTDFLLEKVEFSDKKNSTGGALLGAAIAGTAGAVIGSSMNSSKVYANLYVRPLNEKEVLHVIRFYADNKEAAQLLRLQATED